MARISGHLSSILVVLSSKKKITLQILRTIKNINNTFDLIILQQRFANQGQLVESTTNLIKNNITDHSVN